MEHLISCIVPVHNGERFIEESIDSIVNQTYQNTEIIVVDDGSTDGTLEALAPFEERLSCLHKEKGGPATARNAGILAAKGSFIAFLDSDDKWESDKLERQMLAFADNPDLGICVCHVQNFWEQELSSEEERFRGHPRSKPMPGYVTQALLARREVFDQVGLFDERLQHSDDTDWFLRAQQANVQSCLLPDVLVHRRMHFGNRSRRHAGRSRDEFIQIVKANLDRKRRRIAN